MLTRFFTRLVDRAARALGAWKADKNGVAAMEFAITAPILLLMVIGSFDVTQILIAQQRMAAAALGISEIITDISAQPDATNIISGDNVVVAQDAIFSYFPRWETLDPSRFSVTVTSIEMVASPTNCTTNCTYLPMPQWSQSLSYGYANRRTCAMLLQSPPAPQSPLSIPSGLVGPMPLIAVDITYTYKPIFLNFLSASIPITRSAYLSPRIGGTTAWVKYTTSGDIPIATSPTAPGYSTCP